MSIAIQHELGEARTDLYKLSVRQYHRMLADGLVEEGAPFELLDGVMVRKDRSRAGDEPMTVGYDHAAAILKLCRLGPKFEKAGCHMRAQQPLTLGMSNEPEPDISIVRGRIEDFENSHPTAKDALCVIEVSDSSLKWDRTAKLRIYANHGIANDVIINLQDHVAEVYSEPISGSGRYEKRLILQPAQSLTITAGRQTIKIPLRPVLGSPPHRK